MRKLVLMISFVTLTTVALSSCREEKSEKEQLIEEMKDDGAEIEVKESGDKVKTKMETEDKKVKIVETEDKTKIKVKEED